VGYRFRERAARVTRAGVSILSRVEQRPQGFDPIRCKCAIFGNTPDFATGQFKSISSIGHRDRPASPKARFAEVGDTARLLSRVRPYLDRTGMQMKKLLVSFVSAAAAAFVSPAVFANDGACPVLPATMQAAVIHAAGGPEALKTEARSLPRVADGEVIVQVRYASVNPVDWKLQMAGRLPYPAVPGGDFSGDIVAVGAGVEGFKCGDAVAGIVDQAARQGSYAEYVAVPASQIIAKPQAYSYQEAAAYPTVAVAAYRYLIAAGQVKKGESVLVQGGAGGVGSMVVQIAKAQGARVYATASTRNQDYLKQIGVDVPIDYTRQQFEEFAAEADLIVDTVGGDTLARSAASVKSGGRVVSLAGRVAADVCASGRIICPPTAPWDVTAGLAWVDPLIAKQQLKINIDAVFPLDRAADAQQFNMTGRTRGKVIIEMPVASGDEAAVKIPLQAYLQGHATGDERHFRRAFSSDAVLFGFKDGNYQKRSVEEYLAVAAGGQAPADEAKRRRSIRSVEVTGGVATAVIELEYPTMHALDHMSLLKFEDGWRIVSKTYVATSAK
jgi:NADPH:quinone reductase-like Zn-dependent oxidoreductase